MNPMNTPSLKLRDIREVTESVKPLPEPSDKKTKPPFFQRRGVLIASMIAVPIALTLAAWVIGNAWTRENTDDAFVDGNVVTIAPRVAGKVIGLSVNDNELVTEGAPLFEVDPADFQARVNQDIGKVAVDKAVAASKEAAYQQALAHVETAKGFTESAKASIDQSSADAQRLSDDLARNKSLFETGVISEQEYDDSAKDTLAALAAVKARIAQHKASTSYQSESDRQLEVARADWDSAKAQVAQDEAMLAESTLQLSYTKVSAPAAGRVTKRSVNVGDYVNVGQQVMALVPPDVWITANFKETQLRDMRPGEPVEIRVDAYPGRLLHGHVDSIQAGSGAQFSLLPPENATGNYVKVVQRVPVKIVLDEDGDHLLGPGMSVEPTVRVSDSIQPLITAECLAAIASLGVLVFGFRRLRRSNH